MKNLFYTILLITCITACKKEDKSAQVETRSATGVTNIEATCWGKITEQGSNGIKEYGIELNNFGDTEKIPYTITKADSFGVQIKGLEKGRSYSYRAYAIENNNNIKYGIDKIFKTLIPAEIYPFVKTSTDVSAEIEFNNTEQLREWGVYYKINENATTSDTKVEAKGNKVITLTQLKPATIYNILAYAIDKNGLEIFYEFDILTEWGIPQLSKPAISAITTSGATATFEIVQTGGGTITSCGIRYSTDEKNWTSKPATYKEGAITCLLTGLNPATKYYIQAYARNYATKDGYSETVELTTTGAIPTLAKPTVPALKSYKTNLTGGKVTNDGLLSITEYGFCWSTVSGQAVATGDNYVKVTTGSKDAFDYLSFDFLANTKYYIRVYAKNQLGTGYSEEVTVTTPAVVYGSVQDQWDNSTTYKTVQIGSQTWMAEDLRNNGNGSKTFSGNDVKNHLTDACPTGWHIPSRIEWDDLITETGGRNIAAKTTRIKNELCTYGTNSAGLNIIPATTNGHSHYWTSNVFYEGTGIRNGFYVLFMYTESSGKSGIATTGVSGEDTETMPVRCIKGN